MPDEAKADVIDERPTCESLSQIVVEIANEALASRPRTVHRKDDGSSVTDLDLQLQETFRETLYARWPQYALLGEEMDPDAQQSVLNATDQDFWCLDPLDGTTNFIAGFPFYGVSIALIEDGQPSLGVVYDPERDECFAAAAGFGATLNGAPIHTQHHDGLRSTVACVDLKRLPAGLASELAIAPPYKSQRNIGASVLEWCWLAAGRFHVYVHGSQKLWDYAAGYLILHEAGGCARTLEDETVFALNEMRSTGETRSVVAACDTRLFDMWKTWIAAHSSG